MAYLHGVYVTERATSLTVPRNADSAVQVVFGTAPVNMAADPYACTNVPIRANTFAEATAGVGYSDNFKDYTLCQAIDASFRVFAVAPVVLINVLDPAKHTKPVEESTVAVSNKKATVQTTGLLLDKLTVKNADSEDAELTADTDYIAAFDDDGFVTITLLPTGSASETTSLKVSGTAIDPSQITAKDIVGGVDDTGAETGIEAVRKVKPMLGLTPGFLLAPGWSEDPTVAAALQAKTTGLNGGYKCVALIDLNSDTEKGGVAKYTDIKSAKDKSGVTDPNAVALWPYFAVGEKVYAASCIAGAAYADADASNGGIPNPRLSNIAIPITATVTKDGKEVLLDQEQANAINAEGVITSFGLNGYRLWGNHTACYPGNADPKDCWLHPRRFFIWRANSIIDTYIERVDDPANRRLIENIVDSENMTGNGYVSAGICAGYRVEYNAADNPLTNILNGQVLFRVYLAPYTPAEAIQFVQEFDPAALEAALAG